MKNLKSHTVDWAQIERFLTSAAKKLAWRAEFSPLTRKLAFSKYGSTGIRDRNQQKPFCHTPGQVTETETGLAEVTPHLAMIEHLGEGKG